MEELLKKIIQRLDKMEARFDEVNTRFDKVNTRFDEIEENMATRADIVRLENKMDMHFGALYDAREVQADVNDQVRDSLNRIEKRLDRVSLRTNHNSAIVEKIAK
ncbi:MAG: hypothetical protein GX348_04945 [Veillonellaceae bacterium]|jgi:predicted nuclease with TOPRIM domain|nr:hypothetical protein [Veillonellaceae bacterium]